MNTNLEKLQKIAEIENATYVSCGDKWLSLEEQLEIAMIWDLDVEWYKEQIAERDAQIEAVIA